MVGAITHMMDCWRRPYDLLGSSLGPSNPFFTQEQVLILPLGGQESSMSSQCSQHKDQNGWYALKSVVPAQLYSLFFHTCFAPMWSMCQHNSVLSGLVPVYSYLPPFDMGFFFCLQYIFLLILNNFSSNLRSTWGCISFINRLWPQLLLYTGASAPAMYIHDVLHIPYHSTYHLPPVTLIPCLQW